MGEDEYESGHEGELAIVENVEPEPRAPLPRFGLRPNFREMLAGGNKLTLTIPPALVMDYFKDKVFRSCGCTYDHYDSTFYATSTGGKGRNDGKVMAFDGNAVKAPMVVADDLTEPAAIAVFEQGVSVCVVTNRGIVIFTRQRNEFGETISYKPRRISHRGGNRGIAVTNRGGVVTFAYGKIRVLDGTIADGDDEREMCTVNYDPIINDALFRNNPIRSRERPNCCFMDVVNNRLVMSDLQKHVISLWDIDEDENGASITFVRAIDVATSENPTRPNPREPTRAEKIPLGKCVYASGIRLDDNWWVMCADAEGRTIQIFDDQLNFVTRVQSPGASGQMPYMSGIYVESNGHLMVCDRRSEMGGLRVYVLDSVPDDGWLERLQQQQAADEMCSRMNNRSNYYSNRGGRDYSNPGRDYGNPGRDYRNPNPQYDGFGGYGYQDRGYGNGGRGDYSDNNYINSSWRNHRRDGY